MIDIHIFHDTESHVYEITLKGHADYAEKGKDIVCAGVSTLLYTFAETVEPFSPGWYSETLKEGSSNIHFCYTGIEPIRYIIKTIETGLTMLQNEYPEYIKINYKSFP